MLRVDGVGEGDGFVEKESLECARAEGIGGGNEPLTVFFGKHRSVGQATECLARTPGRPNGRDRWRVSHWRFRMGLGQGRVRGGREPRGSGRWALVSGGRGGG